MVSLNTLEKLVLGIVTVGVILFVGLRIMAELRANDSNTAAVNTAMDTIISAIGGIPAWLVIIVVVVIGGFLILFLRKGLGGKGGF